MNTNNTTVPSYSASSLYVGDLHWDVSEAHLFQKFSKVGPILSIRVCRDMITRRSLGYAYINFQNAADAERALDTMNFDLVKGRPIRLMWSQRDPSLRKSGVGNVFIKNLNKSIDNKALYDTFSVFGNILSCKIAENDKGESKGYGFVHYESEEDAKRAIEKVNGMLLNKKKVYVGHFVPHSERQKEISVKTKNFTNIYINNFNDKLDDKALKEMFSSFGKTVSCKVMRDESGRSLGYGFVSFEHPEAAEAAVAVYNGREIEPGKVLYVGRAQKKWERLSELKKEFEEHRNQIVYRQQGVNLYIKNLDDSINNKRLIEEFSPYGTITSAKVMVENGRSKGFGFVCYSRPEEASTAVTEMNGRLVGSKPLFVTLAQRKEERRAQLNCHYAQQRAAMRMLPTYQPTAGFFTPTLPPHRFMPEVVTFQPVPRAFNETQKWNLPPQVARNPSNHMMQIPQIRLPTVMTPRRITGQKFYSVPKVNPMPIVANHVYPAGPQDGFPVLDERKMLSEQLHALVQRVRPEAAGKITAMLLEIDDSEMIMGLMEDGELLRAKVEEAFEVLKLQEQRKNASEE